MAESQGGNVITFTIYDQLGLIQNVLHNGFHHVDVPVPVTV